MSKEQQKRTKVRFQLKHEYSVHVGCEPYVWENDKQTLYVEYWSENPALIRRKDAVATLEEKGVALNVQRCLADRKSAIGAMLENFGSRGRGMRRAKHRMDVFRSALENMDVFADGKILNPETDLTGDTVIDGLPLYNMSSPPKNRQGFAVVTLSDGTHRLMRWYDGAWVLHKYVGKEVASRAFELVRTARFTPDLRFVGDRCWKIETLHGECTSLDTRVEHLIEVWMITPRGFQDFDMAATRIYKMDPVFPLDRISG